MVSIKIIREKYQPNNEPFIYKIIRFFSPYLSWILLITPITANGVTIVAIILGIIGSILIATSNFILAVVLIWIAIILDFSDGEIARINNQMSLEGEYLDYIYHFTTHPAYFAGILICLFKGDDFDIYILLSGMINCIFVVVNDIVQWYAPSIVHWDKYSRDQNTKTENINITSIDPINGKYYFLKKLMSILHVINRNYSHFPGMILFITFVLILEVSMKSINPLYQEYTILKYYVIINALVLLFWYIYFMIFTIYRRTVTTNYK